MSELSKALGNAGVGHEIEYEGQTYLLKLVDQKVKIALEKKLYQYAREGVTEMRADLTSEQYVDMLKPLADAYANGEFSLEGKRGSKALSTPRGSVLMFSLLTNTDEMTAINIMAAKPVETAQLMELVVKESFPGVKFKKDKSEEPSAEGLIVPKG